MPRPIERDYVQIPMYNWLVENGYRPQLEVKVGDGRVDIVTDTQIIECKQFLTRETGYAAAGQLDYYSNFFPNHQKAVAVYGIKDEAALSRLRQSGIEIYTTANAFKRRTEPEYQAASATGHGGGYSRSRSYGLGDFIDDLVCTTWGPPVGGTIVALIFLLITGLFSAVLNSEVSTQPSSASSPYSGGLKRGDSATVTLYGEGTCQPGRIAPDEDSSQITCIPKGTHVWAVESERKDGWVLIQAPSGKQSYVFFEGLTKN